MACRTGQNGKKPLAVTGLAELEMPPGKRLLGLDLGEKTIGLALSDTLLMVATPMTIKEKRLIKMMVVWIWLRIFSCQ